MKNNFHFGKSRKAKATSRKNQANDGAVNTHSNEGANSIKEDTSEQSLLRKAYEIAPEWKISLIAKRKFMALPTEFQSSHGKEVCVKAALSGHKDLIPDPTRYWIWLVDETNKLRRVWDFEETCNAAGLNPLTVAQHLILEGKQVCNAIRMEGLEAYGSNIRMFVEPLFNDEFNLFGDKGKVSKPQVAEVMVQKQEVAHE